MYRILLIASLLINIQHLKAQTDTLLSLNVLPSESPKINLQYGYHVGQQLNFIPKYNSKVTIGEQFFEPISIIYRGASFGLSVHDLNSHWHINGTLSLSKSRVFIPLTPVNSALENNDLDISFFSLLELETNMTGYIHDEGSMDLVAYYNNLRGRHHFRIGAGIGLRDNLQMGRSETIKMINTNNQIEYDMFWLNYTSDGYLNNPNGMSWYFPVSTEYEYDLCKGMNIVVGGQLNLFKSQVHGFVQSIGIPNNSDQLTEFYQKPYSFSTYVRFVFN